MSYTYSMLFYKKIKMENTSCHVKNKAVRKGDFCLNFPLPTALNTSVYESCFSLFRDPAPSRLSLRILLFHCHRFCQIPGLIHIQALCHTDIISHQLQRHDCQAGGKILVCLRHIYGEICRVHSLTIRIHQYFVNPRLSFSAGFSLTP